MNRFGEFDKSKNELNVFTEQREKCFVIPSLKILCHSVYTAVYKILRTRC